MLVGMIPEKSLLLGVQRRNSKCGDQLDLQITILDGILTSVEFRGHGCVLCVEQAKFLSTVLAGKQVEALITTRFKPDFEIIPTREACFELPYKCMKEAYERARKENPAGNY